MLTKILFDQKLIPSRICEKYFNKIYQLLLNQLKSIRSCESNIITNNRKTKTFFRFSYKKYQMYFEIYRECYCQLPVTYVMSNNRIHCPFYVYLPSILMGLKESHHPSHFKSHPKSYNPIPFVIIPFQSQIPIPNPKSHIPNSISYPINFIFFLFVKKKFFYYKKILLEICTA